MSDGSLFRGTARAGDGACWMRDPTIPAAPIGPVLSHSFPVGSIFRDGIWGVVEAVRATHEVTSAREVERTSKVMASPPLDAAARTVMRLARLGAVRPALRAPTRSTLAANEWVAMAEDMVRYGTRRVRVDGDADAEMEDAIAEAGGADPAQREDAKMCATLFKGLVFFLNREVPREMMVFIIRSFGGEVSWDGEGSPYDEKDGGVTHHVCDRPIQKSDMKPQREYVQPQWVVDCANWRVLIPCVEYAPGVAPPPHLSPFVDAEDEGYTPDYQQTLMRLKAQAKAAREGRSLADVETQIVRLRTDAEEAADEEKQYAKDLSKETSGIPYSRSLAQGEEGSSDEESDDEEDVEVEDEESDDDDDDEESDSDADDADAAAGIKKRKASKLTVEMAMRDKDITINKRMKEMGEDEEMDAMRHVLLPRKKRELYRAMQLGLAKKEQRADTLKDRKEKLKAEGKYGDDKAAGDEAKAKPAAPAKKDAAKKKPVAKKN
eukprot:CAMPEP_0117627908 /NCGR_PEP_ID=MMETSP0802-20121206/2189_1 /TAXON_ID=38833 /ORGANISM="Micromonas sp., Strain CCMP2099" /LENGTH=491 /DNA_ID=CAMNT_0005432095 /DNA_START=131 /DNA_END=1607 /DNA_ORIENTATION=-